MLLKAKKWAIDKLFEFVIPTPDIPDDDAINKAAEEAAGAANPGGPAKLKKVAKKVAADVVAGQEKKKG